VTPRRDYSTEETASGAWVSRKHGEYGASVTARERTPGGPVMLHWTDLASGKRRSRYAKTLDVRDTAGKLIAGRCRAVGHEADRLAAYLARQRTLGVLREQVQPTRITLAEGFARYHDEDTGGLPRSSSARRHHQHARQFWLRTLGKDTPWNAITPAIRDAVLEKAREDHGIPSLEKWTQCLRTVHRWLTDAAEVDDLKDPTRRMDWQKLTAGHDPRRPRHTEEEVVAIWRVAPEVDPRFRLALILAVDSGARSAAVVRATRAMVDERLDMPPPAGLAPHGWMLLPALKHQDRVLTYLTLDQRIEFVRATWKRWNGLRWVDGFLSSLEARWRARGEDYPLIPGGRIPRSGVFRRALAPASYGALNNWLREAEAKAGIEHIDGRAWHSFRRAWADFTEREEGLDVTTTAGGWKSSEMPEHVYTERQKHHRLARSRDAQERRAGGRRDE